MQLLVIEPHFHVILHDISHVRLELACSKIRNVKQTCNWDLMCWTISWTGTVSSQRFDIGFLQGLNTKDTVYLAIYQELQKCYKVDFVTFGHSQSLC